MVFDRRCHATASTRYIRMIHAAEPTSTSAEILSSFLDPFVLLTPSFLMVLGVCAQR